MIYSNSMWENDNQLRAVFSYQTRIGLAPKFGSTNIAHYQQSQCEVADNIRKTAKQKGLLEPIVVSCERGVLVARMQGGINKVTLGFVRDFAR